jgi:hypothetical protein
MPYPSLYKLTRLSSHQTNIGCRCPLLSVDINRLSWDRDVGVSGHPRQGPNVAAALAQFSSTIVVSTGLLRSPLPSLNMFF